MASRRSVFSRRKGCLNPRSRNLTRSAFDRKLAAFFFSIALGCALRAAPIHDAAAAGDLAKLDALLAADPASADTKDNSSFTPLMLAAQNGRLEAATLLLEKGASRDAVTNTGFTSLAIAAGAGKLDVVKLL